MMTGRMDELRAAFGRLIGGDPASVTLTDNTCRAANIAVGILAARPGSNVIDDETTAVCITHVAPFTGRRHDLRALADVCHAHGALLMVDAAQTTGVVPI